MAFFERDIMMQYLTNLVEVLEEKAVLLKMRGTETTTQRQGKVVKTKETS